MIPICTHIFCSILVINKLGTYLHKIWHSSQYFPLTAMHCNCSDRQYYMLVGHVILLKNKYLRTFFPSFHSFDGIYLKYIFIVWQAGTCPPDSGVHMRWGGGVRVWTPHWLTKFKILKVQVTYCILFTCKKKFGPSPPFKKFLGMPPLPDVE